MTTAQQTGEAGILWSNPRELSQRLKQGQLRIAVVGLGRIGLPTAGMLALGGAKVMGVDIVEEVVNQTNAGRSRLVDEPGLSEIVEKASRDGNLRATLDANRAVSDADFIIICVPTPVDSSKSPDYSAVTEVCEAVGRSLRRGSIVIVESTIGPGIAEELLGSLLESKSGLRAGEDFGLASCPERSDPGSIVANMRSVPRIVGSEDPRCRNLVAALYETALGVTVVKVSSPKTANAVKLTENLFRDVNIALANEFALLYEKLGIDTIEVIQACATKYNFMPHFPGAGVGGPCLPSNSYYLISEGLKSGNIPYLIRLAREINDRMPDHVVELASEALNEVRKTIRGSKVVVLGVAYKPGVRDIQLTPIEKIVSRLDEMGAFVVLYDPLFKDNEVFGRKVAGSLDNAVKDADCIIIGTAQDEFKGLDLGRIRRLAAETPALVDARNVVVPEEAMKSGFSYRGVGRKSSSY